jgi:hypothetical protein
MVRHCSRRLERDTGKTMAEWVAIVRTCPEDGHRARLKWLKEHHGLRKWRRNALGGRTHLREHRFSRLRRLRAK